MFGSIGGPELILIAVVALLLFGPRKLPQIGRSVGKALAEFRTATRDFKSSLEREVELETVKETKTELASVSRELKDALNVAAKNTDPSPGARTAVDNPPPAAPPDGNKPDQS